MQQKEDIFIYLLNKKEKKTNQKKLKFQKIKKEK